jgi:cytosine/adenosine deaminase-related metal-dependent hydrolase
VIRGDQLNMVPLVVPDLAAVNCTRPEHVDTVVVNDRIVKRNGALTAADSAPIARDAVRSLTGLMERSGLA